VAVDLTANHVKIVHAKKMTDKIVMAHVRRRKMEEDASQEVSQFVSETFREWGIKKRTAVCVIPSKLYISKNVDMPSNDPEEISKIIDLQAGRYTPYSRDEIVIDYLSMAAPGQHYTNVLLIIINRKLIDKYLRIFDQAGVMVERMAIASEAMTAFYRQVDRDALSSGVIAGVHLDDDSSDLTILQGTDMVFVRSIPVGHSHFRSNHETAQNTFVSELSKSIVAYQDHGIGAPVKHLLITGMTAGVEGLVDFIRQEVPFTQQPDFVIKMIPYPNEFESESAARQELEADPEASYFELMASLAYAADLRLDLIPNEIKLKRRFHEGGKEAMTLGIMIMTCLLMICMYLTSKIYLKSSLLERIETTYEDSADKARTLEAVSTKSRVLRSLIEHRGKGLYVFDKVISLVSQDIYLTSFSYDEEGKIHLLGTAESMSGVFAFVTKLEESGYFNTVTTNETKTRREAGKEVADFDIECELIKEI